MKITPMKQAIFVMMIAAGLLSACNNDRAGDSKESADFTTQNLIADTIYYPVRIKNIDANDEWAAQRLKNLNHQKLVDDIFDAIYANKAQAFNYLTDARVDAKTIQEQETDGTIKRADIVELEFRETWWYNTDRSVFKKEVQSILVASALYDSDGSMRGMKALFYVKMGK